MPRHIVERYEADLRGKAAEIKALADRVNELLGVIAEKDAEIAALKTALAQADPPKVRA